MFYIGLDLGQKNDPTTIAVVERIHAVPGPAFHVRHLERIPLGAPVVYMLRAMLCAARLGCDLAALNITGGDRQTRSGSAWNIPKRDLLAALQLTLERGDLKIAHNLKLAAPLLRELTRPLPPMTPATLPYPGSGTPSDTIEITHARVVKTLRRNPLLDSAILALEDGTVFEGRSFGAPAERSGEVVFNTALTGYQEIFTDPSYTGQIVILTNPQIGNYGTSISDNEAVTPHIEGLAVREFSSITSNWRSDTEAQAFLAKSGIPVISDLDTRTLVRHLRSRGVMRGVISSLEKDPHKLVEKARSIPSMAGLDLASRVTTPTQYNWTQTVESCSPSEVLTAAAEPTFNVVAYDFGTKQNILRRLVHAGCKVTVVPALTSAEDVLALKPDGVFLSNGPGDPEPLHTQIDNVRRLIGKAPIFGICLGHQILGLALGGKTYKMKFGHRGANHPVLNKLTQRIEITSHNHGFAVDPDSLSPNDIDITHLNLNDNTLEGFRHRREPVFCVQYHPEAAPGPHDSHYLFDDFTTLMKDYK